MLRVFQQDLADPDRFVVTLELVPGNESAIAHRRNWLRPVILPPVKEFLNTFRSSLCRKYPCGGARAKLSTSSC